MPINFIDRIEQEVLSPILKRTPHDSLQIALHVNSEKVKDTGQIDTSSFYIKGDKIHKSNIKFDSVASKQEIALERANLAGSGWSHRRINSIDITFFKEGSLVGHGNYVKWPARTRGERKIINIRTKGYDCFPLSIAAHFIHDKLHKTAKKNPDKVLKHYKEKVTEMKFPLHLTLTCAIHDFPEIEQALDIDLWLYKLTNENDPDNEIKLERKGTNPSVDKERAVHLCAINESKHVVLIKEIYNFLKAARDGHVSRKDLPNRKKRKICTMYLPTVDFENHYSSCKSNKNLYLLQCYQSQVIPFHSQQMMHFLKRRLCVILTLKLYQYPSIHLAGLKMHAIDMRQLHFSMSL